MLGDPEILGEIPFEWELEQPYEFSLRVSGTEIAGWINGNEVLKTTDNADSLPDGGFAFVCEEGLITSNEITIKPLKRL